MVSVGNQEKMFEVWIHSTSGSLVFRLTTGVDEVMVLREFTLRRFVPPSRWHMLVISYKDCLDGATFVGEVRDFFCTFWLTPETQVLKSGRFVSLDTNLGQLC